MTVKKKKFPYDPVNPPIGVRLMLGTTAAALGVTVTDMANAAGISRTAIANVMSNEWPVKTEADAIKQALCALIEERGGTPEQVAALFWAQGYHHADNAAAPATNKPATDGFGRPLDANGKRIQTNKPTPEEEQNMLMAKQTLGRAALKAFGIFANPFDGEVTTDEQMFTSPEIAYVREACLQAALGQRFVAVVAESGAGKTTILADLESRLARDSKQVIIIKPWVMGMEDSDARGKTLKAADILASIVTTLDPLAKMPLTLQARSNKARDLLARSVEAGFSHLLMIEEAHCMPDATLKHLKRLHEMRLGRRALLGILLIAQTELQLKLDPRRASLREVTQRIEIVQLMPLDADLDDYLAHRAKVAGKALEHFITADGVAEIRARLTVVKPAPGGKAQATSLLYPLAVNNLMTAALNVAADLGAPVVNRDVVRAV